MLLMLHRSRTIRMRNVDEFQVLFLLLLLRLQRKIHHWQNLEMWFLYSDEYVDLSFLACNHQTDDPKMERTDRDFVDGLAIDLFSPANRTLSVQQNFRPLPGNFVSGSTGETFMALGNYSYVVKVNDTASDLIAKVELPYNPVRLRAIGLDPANTYVGQLSPDKKSWIIDETRRNVHV
jgi:hypothetical protein